MTTLFVDCSYGISGDMLLSALIDVGADLEYIVSHLKQLPIEPFELAIEKKMVHGIQANYLTISFLDEPNNGEDCSNHVHHDTDHHHTHGHVHHDTDHHHTHHTHVHDHHHHHRNAKDIFQMITSSTLPENVKKRSLALFKEIARAEAKIHGVSEESVHFHEVGAMDSIIDIIGVCLALDNLKCDCLYFTPVATGYGKIKIDHGLYPIPAPATSEILVGVPLSDFTCQGELTTPTGASFCKVLATEYQHSPQDVIEAIGYGAGTKSFEHPNVLRVMSLKKFHHASNRQCM